MQGKKSKSDGKNSSQITSDIFTSVFNNGATIIGATPLTKTIGYASGFYSQSNTFRDVLNLQKLDGYSISTLGQAAAYETRNRFTDFSSCVSANASAGSMALAYTMAGLSVATTVGSAFSDNPVQWAEYRDISLV